MHTRAVAKWVRMSPLKVRRIMNLVRGKTVGEATTILRFLPHSAAKEIYKVLWSARANLVNNQHNPVSEREVDGFRISRIFADQGPTLKRIQPHARGRAFPIKKKTSHITIELDDLT